MIKLDDYIAKNSLDQEEVYSSVLLLNEKTLKNHIKKDDDIEIDAYAVDFLNKLFHVSPVEEKINICQETTDLREIEKNILAATQNQIVIDDTVDGYEDDIPIGELDDFDDIDLSPKINDENVLLKEENEKLKLENKQYKKDIESLVTVIKEQNELIDRLNKALAK